MVHHVLLVQRAVNYLLDSTDVVLILKLCVVVMENTAVLMVRFSIFKVVQMITTMTAGIFKTTFQRIPAKIRMPDQLIL